MLKTCIKYTYKASIHCKVLLTTFLVTTKDDAIKRTWLNSRRPTSHFPHTTGIPFYIYSWYDSYTYRLKLRDQDPAMFFLSYIQPMFSVTYVHITVHWQYTACFLFFQELRNRFIFKIVPMLNPDGVIVGNYRCSLAARDLNRNYRHPRKESFPTIWHTKNMIDNILEKHEVSEKKRAV